MGGDYIIKSGDTLSSIAKHYGTTVQQLQQENGIADANKIYAGKKLKISDSGKSEKTVNDEPSVFTAKKSNKKTNVNRQQSDLDMVKKVGIHIEDQNRQKFEEIEKLKNTAKASNGMTYNQIGNEIDAILCRFQHLVEDPKSGKQRFANRDEILRSLLFLSKNGPKELQNMYKNFYAKLQSLISAESELESKYPQFKTKYVVGHMADGTKKYYSDEPCSIEGLIKKWQV